MSKQPESPQLTQRKQLSRARREAQLQQWILIGTVLVTVVVIGLLIFAYVNEQILVPQKAIATVNGQAITVAEFQDRFHYNLAQVQLQQGQQAAGTDMTSFAQTSLDTLVDDVIIEQKARESGIIVSDADVEEYLQLQFGYDAGTPEPTFTPFPTMPPRGTPTITPTFIVTLTPTLTPTPIPGTTATTPPTLTPTMEGTLTETPIPSLFPTATPRSEADYKAGLENMITTLSTASTLPAATVRKFVYRDASISLFSDKLREKLNLHGDEHKGMLHIAHILVASEDEAKKIAERYTAGEDFSLLAAEVSLDTSTGYKGGDLGWLGKDAVSQVFGAENVDAIFNIPNNTISAPIQTIYGWHVIKVDQRKVVPTTPFDRYQQIGNQFTAHLALWRAEGEVNIIEDWPIYVPGL
jgi:parvulin-like peptidyl-prolyl isomerase